jgi:hypothetical protein
METMTLKTYGGKGVATFRPLTIEEVKTYTGSHIWFVSVDGTARQAKVNGKIRTWKRDATRVEVPLKYGLYEYGTFDTSDILAGKLLASV